MSVGSYVMYQGDLEPPLSFTLRDGPNPISTMSATRVRLIGRLDGALVINQEIEKSSTGQHTYRWQSGDTDNRGRLMLEAEVDWPGDSEDSPSRPETFRIKYPVEIIADLDETT